MKVVSLILVIALVFGHFAGQIYLISKAIKRFENDKIFVGLFAFVVINTPSIITAHYADPISFLETFIPNGAIIVFIIWALGISFYGIGRFFSDYWQLYKKKHNK